MNNNQNQTGASCHQAPPVLIKAKGLIQFRISRILTLFWSVLAAFFEVPLSEYQAANLSNYLSSVPEHGGLGKPYTPLFEPIELDTIEGNV